MNKTDKQIYDVKTRISALESGNSYSLDNYYNQLVNLASHNNELDLLVALANNKNDLLQVIQAMSLGSFISNTTNNAVIQITTVPYKARAIFFLSQGGPGFHVGFDNGNGCICMGIYWNVTANNMNTSVSANGWSWLTRSSPTVYSYGKVTTMANNGFSTIQVCGGGGYGATVHFGAIP